MSAEPFRNETPTRAPTRHAASAAHFDRTAFVSSHDTIYIAAQAHEQQLLAPLVVGLLTDIRHAVYQATWHGHQAPWPPVLFLLDECANVAPIPDLPAMLSEAGGQLGPREGQSCAADSKLLTSALRYVSHPRPPTI
jgi:TraM recognition site of TraD and TraG